ncbi:MAG TPA: ABC transporter ATP-binding protein [Vicinamibacterales bacterium]|nr:ABC transporter ATP-binding protein [Vicinamibacterales bacterium]
MKAFIRLLRYARPYRGRLAAALAAMLLYAGASWLLALQIKPIFDEVLPSRERLGLVTALVVGAYLLKGLGSYASVYLMTDVGQRVVLDVRSRLFRHILGQSAGFFARRTSGQLMSRVTNDVGQVQQAVSETIGDLIRESLALVGYAFLLFWYDARLAIVCLTGTPLVLYPLVRLGQRVRRTTRRSQEALEDLSHITAEAFTGHRIVKAFGAEGHEADRFDRAAWRVYRTNLKIASTVSSLPPIMEFVGGLAVVAALWYGSREIARGELTTGDFAGFLFAAFMMYTPIKKLSRVNATLNQAIAASERIFEMLDIHSEVLDRPAARPLAPLAREVEFRNVGFQYDDGDGRQILKGVSFTVKAGQALAIVGSSGAGKTTLVNLVPRFFDLTAGAILIDGVDIRDVTLRSLRAQVGMVTQDTVLFDDTIAHNIAYGSPHASDDDIEAAARAAHAHEFIGHLPLGYETRIGERGQRLSGGQRQRLAIARALLKNPPILILDEATSALDTESERLVQDALARLMQNRTSFVIAHRLSTARRADFIIVLDRGRIVETGRHDELVARPGGAYAKLHTLQFAGARRETTRA